MRYRPASHCFELHMTALQTRVSQQVSHSGHQNLACQGKADPSIPANCPSQVRKPTFCKRIRQRPPLSRLIGKTSRSGSHKELSGRPFLNLRPPAQGDWRSSFYPRSHELRKRVTRAWARRIGSVTR
jgi:hypothetical protein